MINFSSEEYKWLVTLVGEWNNNEIVNITKLMNGVKTIVDIGACFGYSILHYNRLLHPQKILAFEPSSRNLEVLNYNCKNLNNLTVFQSAIYYSDQQYSNIIGDSENPGGKFLDVVKRDLNLPDSPGQKLIDFNETVKNEKLEDVVDFVPDLIKIDVEGAEYNIIENSSLVKESKYLFIEWHMEKKYTENFIMEHLSSFRILAIDRRNSILFENKKI